MKWKTLATLQRLTSQVFSPFLPGLQRRLRQLKAPADEADGGSSAINYAVSD